MSTRGGDYELTVGQDRHFFHRDAAARSAQRG
jgi:hypothetical protein